MVVARARGKRAGFLPLTDKAALSNHVVAFLSSVYLGIGSYWCFDMGNLNMLKERNPQACLTKGCHAGYDTLFEVVLIILIN